MIKHTLITGDSLLFNLQFAFIRVQFI